MSPSSFLTSVLPLIALPGRSPRPAFSRWLFRAIAEFVAQQNLPPQVADAMITHMEACAAAVEDRYAELSPNERRQIKELIIAEGGLGLTGFPSFHDLRAPFPLRPAPVPRVSFPPFPPIEIPEVPGVTAESLVNEIEDKVTGLVGGALETVKETVTQLPFDSVRVLFKFVERVTGAGTAIKSSKLDQGLAKLVESVVLLARDVSGVALATFVNLAVDVVAGTIGGLFLGRPLSRAERDFAHAIFHDKINLTFVQIVILRGANGLTAANTIYVPSLDLSNVDDRARFAHELTHVYQDQTSFDPATLHATLEFLNHYYGSGTNPYSVTLTAESTWTALGVEQQAQVVQNFQLHLDGVNGSNPPVPTGELGFYQTVLSEEGLF